MENKDLITSYTLKKENFIDWLINDHEDRIYFGRRFCNDLIKEHKINVTLEELFNEREYIPVYILEEYDEDFTQFETDEMDTDSIKLI